MLTIREEELKCENDKQRPEQTLKRNAEREKGGCRESKRADSGSSFQRALYLLNNKA